MGCQCLNHIVIIFQEISPYFVLPSRPWFADIFLTFSKSSVNFRVPKFLPTPLTGKTQNSCSLSSFPSLFSSFSPSTLFFSLPFPSSFSVQFNSPYLKIFHPGYLCLGMMLFNIFWHRRPLLYSS